MTIAWNRRLGNLGIDNSWTVRYEWFRFRILFKNLRKTVQLLTRQSLMGLFM